MAIDHGKLATALKAYWKLTDHEASDLAFHLLEAAGDWQKLLPMLEQAGEMDDEELGDEVLGMLQHTPNHLIAAAHLMNQVVVDVWGLGIEIAPGPD